MKSNLRSTKFRQMNVYYVPLHLFKKQDTNNLKNQSRSLRAEILNANDMTHGFDQF